MNTSGGSVEDNGKTDAAISDACRRSGTFALLISIVVCLLVPYWQTRPNEMALGRYLGYRFNLALSLEKLDANPYWRQYRATRPSVETMSISELLGAEVVQVSSGTESQAKTKKTSSGAGTGKAGGSKQRTQVPSGPAPPTVLSVTIESRTKIDDIATIADLLRRLNDSETLVRSQRVSNFFSFSLARWVGKRNNLVYDNVISNQCFTGDLQEPRSPNFPSDYLPPIKDEVLRKCLTLRDVRELTQFEYPTVSNKIELGEHVGQEVNLTPGSFPRDLFAASILAEVFLAFVLIYFNAFAHEAVLSTAFPASGTMFAAFSRSRILLGLFFLALCTPLAASIWLAVASRRVALFICALLVALVVVWTVWVLQSKAYFTNLWRRKGSAEAASAE